MGDLAGFDMEKLIYFSDDLVKLLKDEKDINTLKQSLQQLQTLVSQTDADYKRLQCSIEDYQKKIDICRQKIASTKCELAVDEEADLLQKELKDELQRENVLRNELRVITEGINDLEHQSVSIEERRQVLKKHEQDYLKAQMKLSLYASVTSIIPDLENPSNISGHIVEREKKSVVKFELDPTKQTSLETCNSIWNMINS
ncbi:hypothetical protein M9H77_34479 [Catharanthus roseus]|uniref:Uncharacterized protein n=1 Tax=Catharanthus roseus TaxID=4058 RepID=A0ACB9ZM70_CATRO|nr:hypothetical protein M9H77_34479 [Catharanthus roseus]